MNLVIIDYNSGNVKSVMFALQRLGVDAKVSADPNEIISADKIIFPGVGHAASAMHSLREKRLDMLIPGLKQPFLGICAGMQLLCSFSEEGNTDCLGIFPMKVKRFEPVPGLKIPHTGWNSIYQLKGPMFEHVAANEYMYFVHSYYVEEGEETVALCNYGHPFSAAIQSRNFYGVQFHCELSANAGSNILSDFLKLSA